METIFSQSNNSGESYIAFFDLDGTIINANSGKASIMWSYKKGLMTRLDILRGLYQAILFRYGLKSTAKIINSMVGWLKGVSESALVNMSEEIFKDQLIKAIRPELVEKIRYHKNNGGMVVILSSALMPVCRAVADYLEMDDVICSVLETRDGILTGNTVGSICFGKEKAIRLNKFCHSHNINPLNSWYYGDSADDLQTLGCVGNPVCVNPDKKLLKAAKQRNWEILLIP
jgi:HAD superfamily hydrolase (TIGR01490 family)